MAPFIAAHVLERLGRHTTLRADDLGCWLWTGSVGRDGYGLVWRGKRPSDAHRVVYELLRGLVPEGLVLDHLCRRRLCCRPLHLEAVSQGENERRKSWAFRSSRVRCPVGHDLTLHSYVTPEGGRLCRLCRIADDQRSQ